MVMALYALSLTDPLRHFSTAPQTTIRRTFQDSETQRFLIVLPQQTGTPAVTTTILHPVWAR